MARRLVWNRGRILLGVGCFAALGVWIGWERLGLPKYRSNPDLIQSLRRAPLLAIAQPAAGGDWPQWRGPNRDGLSTESGLLVDWPAAGPPLAWEQPVGRGFSAPVVASGRVYTMAQEGDPGAEREVVLCLDAATGRELWKFRYEGHYEERMGSGPRSTPSVDGDRVYAVGPTGILHCLRATTGEKVWRHDMLEEFHARIPRYGVSFSPLVDEEFVYVTPGGPRGGSVVAFDKRTGALAWQALDDPIGYSSPILATAAGVRQLLLFTDEAMVSLSPRDGSVHWRFPWKTTGGFNIATPVAFDDYVFFSSAYGKGCALVKVGRGEDGKLSAERVYEHNRMRNYFSSSVRLGEHLYAFDNSDLACMDLRTGHVVWRVRGGRGYKKGSLLIADGKLIVLGEDGKLGLAEATPAGFHEIASFRVSENKCWTVPVLAGGRLFVRDEGRLRCLDLRR